MGDVVLHVYKLSTPEGSHQWIMSLLPSIGMGTFHTSLEHDGRRYTFAASSGISTTASRSEYVPTGATFQESISLGKTDFNAAQVKKVLAELTAVFHGQTYHLVHRNCNHFTETFATVLLGGEKLKDSKNSRLSSYPQWVNRLAKTSQSVVSREEVIPCKPWEEARTALGITEESVKQEKVAAKRRTAKKELSDKQKAVLQKLRKK